MHTLASKGSARFGIARSETSASPFLGFYKDGRFVPQETSDPQQTEKYLRHIQAVAAEFPVGEVLSGITEEGKPADVSIEGIGEQSGSGDAVLRIKTVPQLRIDSAHRVFFWTSPIRIMRTPSVVDRIDPSVEDTLRRKGVDLWIDALDDRSPNERARGITFGTPRVQKVSGADDIAVVVLPVIEKYPNFTDERGSVFFIYDLKGRSIVFSTFGHPEWSANAKKVVTVNPLLFFQIEKDPGIYFMAECSLGWKHEGYGLFDLRTGTLLLKTF